MERMADPYAHPTVATVDVPEIPRLPRPEWQRVDWLGSWQFFLFHAAAIVGAVLWPPTIGAIVLCLAGFYLRILGISLAYHRYFAHRTFKTSRWFQFVLAFWAQTSVQKGVLWWAGHHRNHHRFPDRPDDVHSPARRGFFWGHMGWIMTPRYEQTPVEVIRDMAAYPELRWSHVFGRRRFPTTDTSRNNPWLTVITLGEGWHNNHHYFCSSARLGFRWWEFDPTYYLLLGMEKIGLVRDLKIPPEHVLEGRATAADQAAA